ncbi:hypothetical protein L596_016961 [Steinernema carpocapsae]|uniref:Uncharacterized protein n=1 Tax=Steinernema carpocapsae TaxID=34508 RepID=A0A4U5N0B3_STECR|nr:hypothetical protein L596_016961 [Steinernema carpocapsae]
MFGGTKVWTLDFPHAKRALSYSLVSPQPHMHAFALIDHITGDQNIANSLTPFSQRHLKLLVQLILSLTRIS